MLQAIINTYRYHVLLQALLDIKDSIKLPTSAQDSAPAPQADVVSFSKHLEKVGKSCVNRSFWGKLDEVATLVADTPQCKSTARLNSSNPATLIPTRKNL